METETKSNGALVGLIVIIIILIIGGIYIWQSKTLPNEKIKNPQTSSEAIVDQDATVLDALEQDLETIDTNTGVDVNTID